jgi:hypothetical protein
MEITTTKYKTYNNLESNDKNIDLVREMAEVANEVQELQARLEYLRSLLDSNNNLNKYLWKTAGGKVLAIADITDDHLQNIAKYYARRGTNLSTQIIVELKKRGLAIPATVAKVTVVPEEDEEDEDEEDGSYLYDDIVLKEESQY